MLFVGQQGSSGTDSFTCN